MSRLSSRLFAVQPPAPPGLEGARTSGRRRLGTAVAVLGISVAMATNTGNIAQALGVPALAVGVAPVVASSTQFDITGFIQAATVDNTADAHSGGTIKVNGHNVVVPKETVVILPATALTWQEVFAKAPSPYGIAAAPPSSGLALSDVPTPTTTYEAHIVGNRVRDPQGVNSCTTAGGCDRYIAGLVNISQQDLNSGAGYINFIDYANGEIEVGGTPDTQGTGSRVRIDDPAVPVGGPGQAGTGRFGVPNPAGVDPRFQVDQDNPTISAETGFPMCIPRVAPATGDPLCPESNRPVVNAAGTDTSGVTPNPNTPLVPGESYRLFRMDNPAVIDAGGVCLRTPCADPRKQAPFEVGDYVTYAGNLISDNGANGGYVRAHTITASLGIYTQLGVDPAYVSIEVSLIGTGGLTVFGAGEAAVRTRFEGMTTDESRNIRLYGVDINPNTGATTDREWGVVIPDQGPPGGAVRGRWRFRPPCTAPVNAPTGKLCSPPLSGQFIPPTREVRAVVAGAEQFKPGTIVPNPGSQIPNDPNPGAAPKTAANGIYYDQYHAPIEEYIFPENVPGTAIPENNFNTIPFLAYGGYQSATGVQAGRLDPWPSNVIPAAPVCATAAINGTPYSVANGGTIPLSGGVGAGATSPVTVSWTAGSTLGGTDENGALTNANTTSPSYNATGLAVGQHFVRLTVSNVCGVSIADGIVNVTQAPAPTVAPIPAQTVTAGNAVTLRATSASIPTPTWTWAPSATNPAPAPALVQAPAAATASASSTLSFVPITPGTYNFTVTATNAQGTSTPVTATVTVTAATPVNVTLSNEYRISKQRLVVTATSALPATTTMTLQPYLTEAGTTFDPATLGAAGLTVSLTAAGTWTLTAVGAPAPACNLGGAYATPCAQTPLTVKAFNGANLIGTSTPTAITRIRQ